MSEQLPDTEGAIRTYLRANAGVSALVGQRVFFGVDSPSAYPIVTVQRVGGGLDTVEGIVDRPLLQIECVADRFAKSSAFNVLAAVIVALDGLSDYTGHTGTRVLGVAVGDFVFLPTADDRARYVLTCGAVATAAP